MPFISNSVHGLSLGDLVLVENGADKTYTDAPSGETYTFKVLDADTQWGNPQPVTVTLLSLLTNGSQVAHLRDDNREPSIAVTVEASGAAGLAAAEVALRAVVGEPAELRWQPPSSSSAITVFDVAWSALEHKMDSFGERYLRRSYGIKVQALPHARSATKVITPAAATSATTVVVDSGTSTFNWTAPVGPTGTVVGADGVRVRASYNAFLAMTGSTSYGTALQLTASVPVSTTKYIYVDWKSSLPAVHSFRINALPGDLPEVRRNAVAGGYTRSYYRIPDAVTTLSWLRLTITHPQGFSTQTLDIDQVVRTDILPNSGTARQLTQTIYPGGSVPAEGTIKVEHATAGLGHTIVFSHPVTDGYAPPLRQWKSAGAADSTDATLVSGSFTAVSPAIKFSVPWSSIPAGDTQLWARLYRSTAATVRFSWSAYATFAGFANPVGNAMSGFTDVAFVGGVWQLVPLGRFVSPPTNLGSAGQLRVDIAGDAVAVIDEAWLFAMDKGTLTVVDNLSGTGVLGGAANRLRISAPSLDEPEGSLLCGYSADWSDSHTPSSANVFCDQVDHRFDPAGAMIFTVTSGTLDAAVSLEHFPRWHTNAGS